jgi:hypothetical protein
MSPELMADDLKNSLAGCTGGGIFVMWNAICNYVESNAEVLYSWIAYSTTVPPVQDTTVIINAKIDTTNGRNITLDGIENATNAEGALSIISDGMNEAISKWVVSWPIGFTLSVCNIIPDIELTPSKKSDQKGALEFLCSQIINDGISKATLGTAGNHLGIYNGAGSFTSIL